MSPSTPLNHHSQKIETILNQCGLLQYLSTFLEEGFDRIESLFEITESDMVQMDVKRGHRRLLQRTIANLKGVSSSIPQIITANNNAPYTIEPSPTARNLIKNGHGNRVITTTPNHKIPKTPVNNNINNNTPSPKKPNEYYASAGTMINTVTSGMSSTEEEAVTSDNIHRLWKRKYHRHAKPDTNAPVKPPSAYVMFSNHVRAELKAENKSFTDLAKIIGDRWKNISAEEKERYESRALTEREVYLKKVADYQKTDAYKKYQQYIVEFKAKNEAAARPVGRPRKKHRRDGDKWISDENTSDSVQTGERMGSQSEDQQKQHQQYPFYLLNNDDANGSDQRRDSLSATSSSSNTLSTTKSKS
ncbi:HMG-box [Backusella circina FSU 941]|nr:HMG-box [Backusella circina FSU 941]